MPSSMAVCRRPRLPALASPVWLLSLSRLQERGIDLAKVVEEYSSVETYDMSQPSFSFPSRSFCLDTVRHRAYCIGTIYNRKEATGSGWTLEDYSRSLWTCLFIGTLFLNLACLSLRFNTLGKLRPSCSTHIHLLRAEFHLGQGLYPLGINSTRTISSAHNVSHPPAFSARRGLQGY